MTYFGAAEDFADSVESKMATRNSCHSFHNVPRGTLRHFCPPREPVVSQVGKTDQELGFREQCSTWNTRLVFKKVQKSRNVPRGTFPSLRGSRHISRYFNQTLPLQVIYVSEDVL